MNARLAAELAESQAAADKLKAKNTGVTRRLDSETVRLRNLKGMLPKGEREKVQAEMAAKYAARFEKMRQYLAKQEGVNDVVLTLNQITGTLECLQVLMDEGVAIPEDKIKKLKDNKAIWDATIDTMDVITI